MRDEQYEVTAAVYEDIIIAAVLDEEGNELAAERTEQRLVTEAVMGTRSVPDMQGIDQSKLVPLLTAALQEALNEDMRRLEGSPSSTGGRVMSTIAVDSITDAVGSGAPAFPNGVSGNIVSTGNLTAADLTLSGGVYLGGTGAANKLDDYEEGTWTPIYIPQTGSFATMTMSVSEAKYTKIGRFVYIQASILTNNVDTTGASGGLRLSGFPFSSSGFGSFIVGYAQNWGGDVPLYGYIEDGTNRSYTTR
jgi:hypothetical protein